jgi:hypothetical protein
MEEPMEQNKVVIQFKNGNIMKGNTSDFFPNKTQFHLTTLNGEVEDINVEQLKAIFFVKESDGNESHNYQYEDDIVGGGRKISVEFLDTEVVIGYTLSYSPDRHGFFMIPADLKGNNKRIFVVKSATKNVKFV